MHGIDVTLCCDCFRVSALIYHFVWVYNCIHALEHGADAEGSHVQTVHVAMYVWVAMTTAEPGLIVHRHTYGAEEQCAEHAQDRVTSKTHMSIHTPKATHLSSYTKSVCRSRNSYRQEHMHGIYIIYIRKNFNWWWCVYCGFLLWHGWG